MQWVSVSKQVWYGSKYLKNISMHARTYPFSQPILNFKTLDYVPFQFIAVAFDIRLGLMSTGVVLVRPWNCHSSGHVSWLLVQPAPRGVIRHFPLN
jgi:hypothetical protein